MKRGKQLEIWSGLLLILLFCPARMVLAAPVTPLTLSLGFDFASGDYGTTQTTDSYRVPLTIGYYPSARLDFSLEFSYLYQNGDSTVFLGGRPFPMHGSGGMSGGTGGMSGTGGMGGTTASSVTSSQSGVGDISLTAGYALFEESDSSPMLRPLVYVKVPTADDDKGLGTGAFDYGVGLSIAKGFGDWFLYAESLYIIPGSTSTYQPDNYLTYLGSARYLLTQKLDVGCELSGATAAFAENPDALEAQLTTNYQVSQRESVGAYLGTGLSDSSPDITGGLYGSLSF